MSLYNYLVKSSVQLEEIQSSFSREEVKQLYTFLKESGYEKHFFFVKEHRTDILKYISQSDSQRHSKKWMNNPDLLSIRFAALQLSSATVRLLSDIEPVAEVVDSGSYRSFHSIVAVGVANLLFARSLADFPFEGFDNPFFSFAKV